MADLRLILRIFATEVAQWRADQDEALAELLSGTSHTKPLFPAPGPIDYFSFVDPLRFDLEPVNVPPAADSFWRWMLVGPPPQAPTSQIVDIGSC